MKEIGAPLSSRVRRFIAQNAAHADSPWLSGNASHDVNAFAHVGNRDGMIGRMRTLDITIEDATYDALDAASRDVGMTPAEFVRRAAAAAVRVHRARDAARRDEIGYTKHPVGEDEFAVDPADLMRGDDAAW